MYVICMYTRLYEHEIYNIVTRSPEKSAVAVIVGTKSSRYQKI